MIKNTVNLDVLTKLDSIQKCRLNLQSLNNQFHISYSDSDFNITVKNENPFFTLVELRKELEEKEKLLMCKGSRYDVYPSGLSRIGVIAYILELGKPAIIEVDIFDKETDRNKIKFVEDQLIYRKKWIKSMSKNPKIWAYLDKES